MNRLSKAARAAVTARYGVLVVVVLGCTVYGVFFDPLRYFSDWLIFEIGARTLTHWHHMAIYSGAPLHLYADDPVIQIGPPALLLVATSQWLSPHVVSALWVGIMALMGVATIGFLEASAHRLAGPAHATRIRVITLVTGAPLLAAWGYECAKFHHLDDALALLCTAVAAWLCATRRAGWLIGLALGIAAASKPWAIVMAPLILGLPREERAPAALGLVATAAAFWGPFVIAAPATVHSLGLLHIVPRPGSILYLFGARGHVEGWLRSVQFGLGVAAAAYVAMRGRWTAAPLVGIAVRVALDPYAYAYYGLGPVVAALLWDLTRPSRRGIPVWTLGTLLVEFGVRLVASSTVEAVFRLAWVISVLGVFLIAARRRDSEAIASTQPDLSGAELAIASS